MSKWKVPVHRTTGQVRVDTWGIYDDSPLYELRDPWTFYATLYPVRWFPTRSSGGIVFQDKDGLEWFILVSNLLPMLPLFVNGSCTAIFGFEKNGTHVYTKMVHG